MKITVINGQNHKGSTYNMGKILADKLSDDVTEIFLPLDSANSAADVIIALEKAKCYVLTTKSLGL
mgnify:CR=1 FL=1